MMETFGKFCFVLIAIIFSTLIGGFVFMTLWKWFIAETFEIRQITLLQAIGLMILIGYLKPKPKNKEDETGKKATDLLAKALVDVVVYASVSLVFGWIIHQLM